MGPLPSRLKRLVCLVLVSSLLPWQEPALVFAGEPAIAAPAVDPKTELLTTTLPTNVKGAVEAVLTGGDDGSAAQARSKAFIDNARKAEIPQIRALLASIAKAKDPTDPAVVATRAKLDALIKKAQDPALLRAGEQGLDWNGDKESEDAYKLLLGAVVKEYGDVSNQLDARTAEDPLMQRLRDQLAGNPEALSRPDVQAQLQKFQGALSQYLRSGNQADMTAATGLMDQLYQNAGITDPGQRARMTAELGAVARTEGDALAVRAGAGDGRPFTGYQGSTRRVSDLTSTVPALPTATDVAVPAGTVQRDLSTAGNSVETALADTAEGGGVPLLDVRALANNAAALSRRLEDAVGLGSPATAPADSAANAQKLAKDYAAVSESVVRAIMDAPHRPESGEKALKAWPREWKEKAAAILKSWGEAKAEDAQVASTIKPEDAKAAGLDGARKRAQTLVGLLQALQMQIDAGLDLTSLSMDYRKGILGAQVTADSSRGQETSLGWAGATWVAVKAEQDRRQAQADAIVARITGKLTGDPAHDKGVLDAVFEDAGMKTALQDPSLPLPPELAAYAAARKYADPAAAATRPKDVPTVDEAYAELVFADKVHVQAGAPASEQANWGAEYLLAYNVNRKAYLAIGCDPAKLDGAPAAGAPAPADPSAPDPAKVKDGPEFCDGFAKASKLADPSGSPKDLRALYEEQRELMGRVKGFILSDPITAATNAAQKKRAELVKLLAGSPAASAFLKSQGVDVEGLLHDDPQNRVLNATLVEAVQLGITNDPAMKAQWTAARDEYLGPDATAAVNAQGDALTKALSDPAGPNAAGLAAVLNGMENPNLITRGYAEAIGRLTKSDRARQSARDRDLLAAWQQQSAGLTSVAGQYADLAAKSPRGSAEAAEYAEKAALIKAAAADPSDADRLLRAFRLAGALVLDERTLRVALDGKSVSSAPTTPEGKLDFEALRLAATHFKINGDPTTDPAAGQLRAAILAELKNKTASAQNDYRATQLLLSRSDQFTDQLHRLQEALNSPAAEALTGTKGFKDLLNAANEWNTADAHATDLQTAARQSASGRAALGLAGSFAMFKARTMANLEDARFGPDGLTVSGWVIGQKEDVTRRNDYAEAGPKAGFEGLRDPAARAHIQAMTGGEPTGLGAAKVLPAALLMGDKEHGGLRVMSLQWHVVESVSVHGGVESVWRGGTTMELKNGVLLEYSTTRNGIRTTFDLAHHAVTVDGESADHGTATSSRFALSENNETLDPSLQVTQTTTRLENGKPVGSPTVVSTSLAAAGDKGMRVFRSSDEATGNQARGLTITRMLDGAVGSSAAERYAAIEGAATRAKGEAVHMDVHIDHDLPLAERNAAIQDISGRVANLAMKGDRGYAGELARDMRSFDTKGLNPGTVVDFSVGISMNGTLAVSQTVKDPKTGAARVVTLDPMVYVRRPPPQFDDEGKLKPLAAPQNDEDADKAEQNQIWDGQNMTAIAMLTPGHPGVFVMQGRRVAERKEKAQPFRYFDDGVHTVTFGDTVNGGEHSAAWGGSSINRKILVDGADSGQKLQVDTTIGVSNYSGYLGHRAGKWCGNQFSDPTAKAVAGGICDGIVSTLTDPVMLGMIALGPGAELLIARLAVAGIRGVETAALAADILKTAKTAVELKFKIGLYEGAFDAAKSGYEYAMDPHHDPQKLYDAVKGATGLVVGLKGMQFLEVVPEKVFGESIKSAHAEIEAARTPPPTEHLAAPDVPVQPGGTHATANSEATPPEVHAPPAETFRPSETPPPSPVVHSPPADFSARPTETPAHTPESAPTSAPPPAEPTSFGGKVTSAMESIGSALGLGSPRGEDVTTRSGNGATVNNAEAGGGAKVSGSGAHVEAPAPVAAAPEAVAAAHAPEPAAGGAATGAHDGATPNAGASEVASAGTPEAKGSASEPQSVSPAGHEALADSSVGQPEALASASPAAAHGELAPERAGDGRERAGDGRERAGDGRERAGDDREGNPAERAGTEMGDAALGMADIGASRAGAEGAAEGARRRGASEEAGEPKGSGAGRETGSAEGGPDSEPAGKKGGRTSEADAESASAGAEQPGNGAAPEAAETAAPGRRNAAGAETSGEGAEPAARRASEGKADESGKAAEPKAKGDAVERLKQVDALVGRGRRAVGEMLSGVRAKLESSENPVARAVRFTAKVSMTTGAALERFGEKVDRKMDLVNVLLIKGWRKVFGGGPIEYDASGRRLVVKKDKNGVEHKEPVHPGIIANDIMELGRYLQGKLHSDGVRPPTTDEIWNAKPRPDAKAPPTEPGGGRPPGTPPRIEPVLMRRAIAEAHPDKDVPTSVGRRPVADSEAARKLRHEQRFVRRPGYPEEDVFVQNSTKANELFNRWLSGEEGSAGLRETMEAMHKLYAGDGEIGKGQGGQYAPDGAAVNKRALRVRQFVKDYYGLEANPDGAVHLPGIPVEMSPHFVANHYFYPDSKIPGMRDTYYKAMEAQVARYSDLVGKVDAMKAADPNYAADPRYQAAVKEALGAVADFGQIAAAFRQFRNGNWGLYGPMMNSMVNRMGLEIKYPGYLDLILQSATEASAKPFFVDAVLNGKSFFPADGYDPLTGKTVAPFQPVDLTVAAGVDPVLAGELGPRISARYERLAELKREYERELRGRNPSVEKLDAMREEYAGLRKLNVEDQTHLAAAQNASWNPGDPLTAKVFDMMAANMGARVETLSVVRDDSPNALKRLFSNEGIAPNRSQTTRDFDVSGTHLNEYGSGHVVSVAEKLNTGMAILSMGLDGANLRLKGIMLESAPVPGAKVPDIFLKYGGRPGEGALRQQEVLVTDIAEGSIAGARLRKIVNLDGSDVTEVKAGRYLFRYSDLIPLDHARLNSPERAAYIQEYQAAVDGAKLTHAMEFEIPADLAPRLGGPREAPVAAEPATPGQNAFAAAVPEIESLGGPKGVGSADASIYEKYFDAAEIRAIHPEPDSGGVYHDWQHTVKVADMAREFARSRGLPPDQVKFVSEVGLLHDIDPTRAAGMPARVPETLARLREDFAGTKSLTGEPGKSILKERFGWDARKLKMAEAMIQRTEFPFGDSHPSPAYKGTSPLARYEALLRELPPSSQAFVLREGALLSEYADKSSWYATEDFNGAHKTVEGLVDEINRSVGKPVMDVGKLGTDGFLDKIGAPESFDLDQALAHKLLGRGLELPGRAEAFALLPESYGRTFDSNLEGFRALNAAAKAGDPNPFAKGLAAAETALKTVRIDPAANRAFLKNAAEQYRRASHDDPPAEWIARARVLPKAKLEKVLSNEGSSGLVFQGRLADGTPVAIKTFSEHPTMGAAMWGDRLSYFDGEVGNYRVMEAALPRGLTPKFHGEVDVSGNPSFAMEMIVGKDPDALTAREAAAMSPKAAAQVRDAIEALGRAGYGGYDSPQPMILTRDQVINGVARSKGEVAFMDAGGLTRDTRAWLTPERFASELILWREIGRRFADSRPDATVSELIGSMPREERTALRAAAEAEVAALPREPADPGRTAVDAVASVVGQAPVEGIVESILRGSGPAAPAAKPGLVEGAAVTVAERIAPDLGGAARLDKAGPPRASVSLGRVDGLIGAERAALKDWKTLDAAGRERVSEQLVDQAARTLTDAGYVVRKAPADGGYKLIIDSMPGRPGRFLRGVRALYGDRAPAFEYNPGELGDRQGSGAQFNGPKNVLEFDAASLALTDAGSLAIVKHELRHGRQARALREGEINANHGWLAFADEGPRRDLGIYDADFQIDEVLTYSKQQIDTATDLRRMLGRLQSEGTGFLSEGNNRAILESALKQADVNYYSAMNLSRALKESAETIRGTFETVRPAEVEKLDGNVAHVYKNASGGEGLVVEFMTNERLGPDGMAAVQFPAIRRGRPVLTAEGEPAIDFMAIPIPKGEMAAFERDPAAARRYIEDHLERAVRDADARRAGVLERQPAISDLVSEVRVAASAPPLARAEAAVPAAEAAGAVLPADVAGEPESPLKLPSGEKKRGLRQLEISLKERGADEVFAIAEKLYYTDPLTSLPNRASFFDKALGVVPSLERPALAMLDMNNFGAVNVGLTAELGVTKGRARADGVLTIAGASLGEIGREYGVSVSRLGGEEFVALGSLDSVQKFTAAANTTFKPLRLLEESGMTQGGSERAAIDKAVADARRDPEHVADFTYGIAEIKGRSLDDALKAADEALGHGKDKIGRGAVMLETADGYVELKPAGSVKGLETLPRPQPIDTNAELERLEALLTPQERKVFNEAAFKDPLTLTRSYDYVSLKAAEWNGRYADGGMVLLSSARNLKQINDILGHEAGDVYLRKLGAIIRTELNSARRSQLNAQEPVRVASKEFMIVGRDAAEVTRRIQAKVAEKFDKGEMLPPEQVARVRAESIARKAVTEDGAALIGTLRAVSEDVRGPDGVADVQGALDRAFIALESAKEAETKAGARERPAAAPDGQPLPPIRKTMRPTDLRAGPGDGAAAPAVRPSGDESGGIGASGRRDGVWARLAERSPAVGAAESMLSALRRPVEDAVGAFNRLTGRGPPPAMANVLEFGAGDWARFSVDRVDVRERRSNARMFGDRFKAVNAELDAVRLDAAARIKDAGDKAAQKAIEAERDAAVSTKLWELTDRFGVENLKADQLTTIYNTFKDHGRFADMIKLYDRATDPDFRNAVVVRQLLAVALHKTGDLARSEQTILQRGESQRSGEDYTILAKIYKLRYEEAMKAGRTNEARVHLDRSIAALEKGFEKDYEYYPGINLVYNLMTRGAEFRDPAAITRAEEKAQLVLLAAKKAGGLHSSDFWTLTTLLESATITGQDREISAVLPKVLANANVEWMVQAPIDNLVKLRDQLKTLPSAGTPERVARIDGVIDALQHRLETLTEKVQVPTAKSRGAQLAESVLNQGHSFAEMARRLSENGWALGAITTSSVGGNIPFGGQLHSAIVNRWDFTVGRDFLGHLHLDAKTDLATFNRTVDAAIRERFGTDKDDLENLHSDGHKVFDAFTKTLLDVTAVGRGGDSRTNIMVDFLLGKGDCRHHAYVKQLLFDIWKTDKMNALMRTADAQLESGDHSGYQKILTDIGALERVRMLTFDSVVNAPIVLGPGGKYDVDLTEKGQFKTDGVARPVEDHTWNGLVEINDAGELTHLTMVDSFYQNAYRFGGGAGVPVPLDRVHLTDNGGIDISAERVQAVAEDGTVQPIDVTLTPTSYAGGTKVNPNRDDYEQVRLRGLEISPAKPDFTAKTKASIDGFITRLLADEYRRQLQFDALTKSLKDKDFALEMAAWQDGAYYRGQNQEPPPFLTPEEKAGTVTKSVADEKIAMNLAGFYADESGIGVLAERSGKSPAEIVDAMAKGELPEEDMLLIARFANATWKAGQPFRSLDRITRDTFRPAVLLTEPELMKDFDQIKAAAGKLSEKMADVRTAPRDVQLAKLKELLQSKDFALEIAAWQDGAYYRGQGQEPPPFLTPEEKAGTVTKSVADEKVAMNLAGFYAVESGLGVLAETTGKTPRELLRSIVDGTMSEKDMLLIARFANATWKAGQPFRSLDRITRDTFRPAALLTDPELAKDFDQIKAAAQKLNERVAVLEVAAYDDPTRAGALKALKASDMPAGGWRETLAHPVDAVRRLLGMRMLSDAQVDAVMRAHNEVPCNVYRCTPAQLLAKVRIMDEAGISMAVREKLIREGFAGSEDPSERETEATSRGEKDELPPLPPRVGTMKPTDTRVSSARPTQAELEARRQERVARRQTEADQLRAANDAALAQRTAAAKTDLGKLSDSARETIARSANTMKQLERVGGDFTGAHTIDQHGPSVADAALKAAVVDPPDPNNPASFLQGEKLRNTRFVSDAAMAEGVNAVERVLAKMGNANANLAVELKGIQAYNPFGKPISVNEFIHDFNAMATKTGNPEVTFDIPVPGPGSLGVGFENLGGNKIQPMTSAMRRVRVTLRMDHFRMKTIDSPIFIKTLYPVP